VDSPGIAVFAYLLGALVDYSVDVHLLSAASAQAAEADAVPLVGAAGSASVLELALQRDCETAGRFAVDVVNYLADARRIAVSPAQAFEVFGASPPRPFPRGFLVALALASGAVSPRVAVLVEIAVGAFAVVDTAPDFVAPLVGIGIAPDAEKCAAANLRKNQLVKKLADSMLRLLFVCYSQDVHSHLRSQSHLYSVDAMPHACSVGLGRKPRRRTGPSVLRHEKLGAASLVEEALAGSADHLSLRKGGPDPAIRIQNRHTGCSNCHCWPYWEIQYYRL